MADPDPMPTAPMVDMVLGRIVIRDDAEQQYIFLQERDGARGFPIVIGTNEACEIHRVVTEIHPERPLTHQLSYAAIKALGAEVKSVDIVDLRNNTFFARLVLTHPANEDDAVVDARPSDAIALALRARCPIRVAESVLEQVRSDASGPDPLPDDLTDDSPDDSPDEP